MNIVQCEKCGKSHRVEYGLYPDADSPFVEYAVVFDPINEYRFVFVLKIKAESKIVACALNCKLADEADLTYLDANPYTDLSLNGIDSFLCREDVLSSGLSGPVFEIVKSILSTDPSLRPVFKKWCSSV